MNRFAPILSALLIAALATLAVAQNTAFTNSKAPELFPLDDLRPGMKGIAKTVFSGSETQDFGV